MEALARIDDGAYANLVLPELFRKIEDPGAHFEPLDYREKAYATELVYGTTRMRRACDWIVSRHLNRQPDDDTERALHLGAYQLVFLGTPPHAAVAATVSCAPLRSQGFVNAVLRRIAKEVEDADGSALEWPSLAVELSYPDWIVSTLERDLGSEAAHEALWQMNEPAVVHRRADGYYQDPASQMVAAAVEVRPGDRVLDVCAAPGGKATAMAAEGAYVTAIDIHEHRCALVQENAEGLGVADLVDVQCLDATALPAELVGDGFDRVLVDAPCSGLGSLRRRPDARWRMSIDDVADLVLLQRALLTSGAAALKVGGTLVYSVCTLTDAESVGNDRWLERELPELVANPPVRGHGWEPHGRGARILPGETDGMCVFRYTKVATATAVEAEPTEPSVETVDPPVETVDPPVQPSVDESL